VDTDMSTKFFGQVSNRFMADTTSPLRPEYYFGSGIEP
jgi:hypothetical protein